MRKRDDNQQHIDYCRAVDPQDGQVVYATETENREEDAIVIEEGAVIRNGQAVILLPDPDQMCVGVRMSETKLGLLRQGRAALIYLDMDPLKAIEGRVQLVGTFPLGKRRSYHVNEYRAIVELFERPPTLRPGLRAKVQMSVDTVPDVLQIPITSVFVHAGQHFCITKPHADGWQAQQIEIGSNNDKFVIVREGLQEGTLVASNADDYRELVSLPPASSEDSQIEDIDEFAQWSDQLSLNDSPPDLTYPRVGRPWRMTSWTAPLWSYWSSLTICCITPYRI